MPKETFFNLPEEKRSTIQEAAVAEFAENGFERGSINRIVAAAGIAKGSFYQYFDDKADLYKQIIAYISEIKMAYISPVLMNPAGHDFFTLLEELYRSGLAFAKDYPMIARMGNELFENKNHPVFKELMQESKSMASAFFGPLLDQAIDRGEVDPNINKEFVIYMMMQMQISSLDYYLDVSKRTGLDDDFLPTIRLMLNFIRYGIGADPSRLASRNKGENNQ